MAQQGARVRLGTRLGRGPVDREAVEHRAGKFIEQALALCHRSDLMVRLSADGSSDSNALEANSGHRPWRPPGTSPGGKIHLLDQPDQSSLRRLASGFRARLSKDVREFLVRIS